MIIKCDEESNVFDILDVDSPSVTCVADETGFNPADDYPKSVNGHYIPVRPTERETHKLCGYYGRTAFSILLAIALGGLLKYDMTVLVKDFMRNERGMKLAAFEYAALLSEDKFLKILITMGASAFALFAAFLVGCRLTKLRPRTFLERRRRVSAPKLTLYIACAFCIAVFTDECTIGVAEVYGLRYGGMSYPDFKDFDSLAMWGVCYIIVLPLLEELFFRGVVLKNLSRANIYFGIVATSAFSALFMRSVWQVPHAAVMSVVLSFLAFYSGSVRSCIIVHAAVNALMLPTQYLRELLLPDRTGVIWLVMLLIPIPLIIRMLAYIFLDAPVHQYGYHHKTRGLTEAKKSCFFCLLVFVEPLLVVFDLIV